VAFAPLGPCLVIGDDNGFWGPGSTLFSKVNELRKSGCQFQSVTWGSNNDSWVILYDQTSISYNDIPDDLAKILNNAVSKNIQIQCVAFTGKDWICLARDDWWASNTNLLAAKYIKQEFKLGHHPKWIAFVPTPGHINPHQFGTLLREAMADKFAGGYECVVIDHGKVVVALADGWARAPWEKVAPAIKMTVNMPMALASVSKTISAVGILKLWEECAGTSRQFSLDEPFWPHLKELYPDVNEDVKKITIRQLLMHRGGFTSDFGDSPAAIKKLLALSLPHPPGTFSKYLNANYGIINLLIQQMSGMDCPAYVKSHVLAPMGITDMDTVYHGLPAMCVYAKPGDQESGEGYWHINNKASHGINEWFGSAMAMGRFLEGIRQCRVLSPATTAMMFNQNLGWGDSGYPKTKGGLGVVAHGRTIKTTITYFQDGVEAVLLVNCDAWFDGFIQALKDARN